MSLMGLVLIDHPLCLCLRSVSSPESKDEVESGVLLDVVISQGSTVIELLSSKDETLLIRRDSLLVLDLLLELEDSV